MLAPNTVLQGRYLVIRKLGQGGMGTVYEALDQRLSSKVALKETFAETPEARRAFEREAALLANLRHSALPKVIDYFAEGDAQILVMEFISGHDLSELLALRGRAFSPEEVLRWGEVVLGALEFLHTRTPPIIHRDIKPGNLKLTDEGELFLLDFGLAKGAAGQMTMLQTSRSVVGYTPVYSSLEQVNGTGTDQRSDIYSLGTTLYHLITGVMPKDAVGRATAVMNGEPDPLQPAHTVNPQVSVAVSRVISRAMEQRRMDRPESAAEFRAMIQAARRGEPYKVDVLPPVPTILSGTTPVEKKDEAVPRRKDSQAGNVIREPDRGAVAHTTRKFEQQQNTAGDTIVSTGPLQPQQLHGQYASHSSAPEERRSRVAWLAAASIAVLVIVSIVGFSLWGSSTEVEPEHTAAPSPVASPTIKDTSQGAHQSANDRSTTNATESANTANTTTYNTNTYNANTYSNPSPASNTYTANTPPVNRSTANTNRAATVNKQQKPRRRKPSTSRDTYEY